MKSAKRELKIWAAAAVIGAIMATVIATQTYAQNVQNEIAENVIRFHVVANSDQHADQDLKNFVRDGVLNHFELDPTAGIEETREFLLEHLSEIEEYAAGLIQLKGLDYPVKAVLGRTFFPTRDYGRMSFPAGEYEAIRIIIGEGSGGNWWCVMFPPLCYVDAATPDPTDHTVLRNLLSEDTYTLMNHSQEGTGVTVRFKVVEWWQEQINGTNEAAPMFVLR